MQLALKKKTLIISMGPNPAAPWEKGEAPSAERCANSARRQPESRKARQPHSEPGHQVLGRKRDFRDGPLCRLKCRAKPQLTAGTEVLDSRENQSQAYIT